MAWESQGHALWIIIYQVRKCFQLSSFQSPGSLQKQCAVCTARRMLVWTPPSLWHWYAVPLTCCPAANSQQSWESSFCWERGCVFVSAFAWTFSCDTLLDNIWIVNFALFSLHLNEEQICLFNLVSWVDDIHSFTCLPCHCYTIIYSFIHLLTYPVFDHEEEYIFLSLFLAGY